LNSLWEGAGNVQCLDVLRAMHKDPGTVEALQQEIASTCGFNSIFDRFARNLILAKQMRADAEFGARWSVEKMALALQAAALIRSGNQRIADAFCSARLTDSLGLSLERCGRTTAWRCFWNGPNQRCNRASWRSQIPADSMTCAKNCRCSFFMGGTASVPSG
jgi:hypothetical protein